VRNFFVIFYVVLLGVSGCATPDEPPQRSGSFKEVPVDKETTSKPNRLIHEKSPYLLQHAYNPVDWFAWGEEAFRKAQAEQKPIFLSIGYSTCHWCHVMEEESFSSPQIAKIMNDHFVSIKVDREERPDVDNLYMSFVTAMAGSGGWPLNVFLTPDQKPFYGGTYFPPEDMWGRPGFKTVLLQLAEAWSQKREEVIQSGESITQALQEHFDRTHEKAISLTYATLQKGMEQYASQYDPHFGGFGAAPKFPRSHSLSFLLRYWKRSQDPKALQMVETTLQAMARGGMHDHLGGGFHRYSTDREWRISHFEKMLYDQAILARSYLEAYQATRNEYYADVARDIFRYVLQDMQSPEGGFFSAEDADSAPNPTLPHQKSEGAFYLWSHNEILRLLGESQGPMFQYRYGIEPDGNAFTDPHGEFSGKNVLYEAHTVEATAKQFKTSVEQVQDFLTQSREILLAERAKRLRPHLDDKILVDWNGLMISTLAFGSQVLQEPRYEKAARQSADFILQKLVSPEGRLLHRYRDGEAGILGTLEDYAFFVHGLLELYEVSFEIRYLEEAFRLTQEMIKLFWDEVQGGLFLTASDAQPLLFRPKEIYDGAIPSGNSVAALNLLRLGRLSMNQTLEQKAEQLMESFSAQVAQMPMQFPQFLIALDFMIGPSQEIVLAGEKENRTLQDMHHRIYERFLPNKVVALHTLRDRQRLEALAPFVVSQRMIDGKTTAYVCENYVCRLPTRDVAELERLLKTPSVQKDPSLDGGM